LKVTFGGLGIILHSVLLFPDRIQAVDLE